MFRHLMKLIWKRKSRNLMLSLEILLAFAVVFAIAAVSVRYTLLYQLPVGIATQDVWSVKIETEGSSKVSSLPDIYDNFKRDLLSMPEVEKVSFSYFPPFENSDMSNDFIAPGKNAHEASNMLVVNDDFFGISSMKLLQGRWFSKADATPGITPIVVNTRMAQALFAGQPAVGRQIDSPGYPGVKFLVTGVVDDYRNKGELMEPVNFTFVRFEKGEVDGPIDIRTILLKLKPGTSRAFEAQLNSRLKMIRNDWSYQISPLSDMRRFMLRTQLTPLVVGAIVASFLLLMVGFGLFGVLWQNVTQRIPEIGLRRAVGADTGSIYRQIIGEQLLLSSIAMAVALILLVQLPVTGALGGFLNWKIFACATVLSVAAIYLISLLCALYPGWQASRLSPREALHYE